MQQNERCSLIRLKMYLVERIFIMQAIVETLFDTVYLFSVITIGILMIRKSKGNRQFTMFGIMAVILRRWRCIPSDSSCSSALYNRS